MEIAISTSTYPISPETAYQTTVYGAITGIPLILFGAIIKPESTIALPLLLAGAAVTHACAGNKKEAIVLLATAIFSCTYPYKVLSED